MITLSPLECARLETPSVCGRVTAPKGSAEYAADARLERAGRIVRWPCLTCGANHRTLTTWGAKALRVAQIMQEQGWTT